ncbi:protein HEATR9 [Candoia aspera]|uniref:protein HEATR9 n=1 Tax=Candoia aspera TaxID=51853 RepID=UPI002FD7E3C8
MGWSKIIPELTFNTKPPQKLLWSSMILNPEDQEAAKAAQLRIPKDSFHQVTSETYPPSPFKYRTRVYSFDPDRIQPTIVEQPDPASLKKQCPYRKKLEKAKSKSRRKKSEFLLSKFVKLATIKKKEIYVWNEIVKPERIKVLIKSLASPLELEQLYAAQALGYLGVAEDSVISALYNIVQECDSPALQYEAARSLALLGCLETCVMKVLIRHLKVVSLNRREDTLAALKQALQAWSITPSFEWYCIGARSSLIRNLQHLVNLQEPLDNITFNAALCLGYLDKSNPSAQETMFLCLAQADQNKRFQALVMLVQHMDIMNAIIIQEVLDYLENSLVFKYRADATKLLTTIGLDVIQQEGLEEDVFNVLLKKLSDEPYLIVRQRVALAVEELQMKKRVWEIVEKQLKEEDDMIRKQAVIALGVLGIRHKSVFFTLLEMLELDTNEDVRIQVIRAFCTLGMDNMHVRKSLKNKKQGGGILARESSKALEMLDQSPDIQKELMLQPYIMQ